MRARLVFTALSTLSVVVLVGLASLGTAGSAAAHEEPVPSTFRGLINDYTPSSVSGGPYEMHGKWHLELNEFRGTANFTAEMSMETAQFASQSGQADPSALTTGFVVTGLVHITGNGQPAPFEVTPGTTQLTPSPLTICVTGGAHVEFSNITLVLGAPAAKHFGTQAVHGVVVSCNRAWARESGDCAVQD
jgi:hypothetical protein